MIDPHEYNLRLQELSLKDQELTLKRREGRRQTIQIFAAMLTALVAIAAGYTSFRNFLQTQKDSVVTQEQTRYSAVQANFIAMVDELSSDRPEVRVLAVRRLTQFVEDPSNFQSESCSQSDAEGNLIQAFETALQAEAPLGPSGTLTSFYHTSQPDDVFRILALLNKLDTDGVAADRSVSCTRTVYKHAIYLSYVDLHGVRLALWQPKATDSFTIRNSDLRVVNLTDLDLRDIKATLTGDSFACANMTGANFGEVDLTGSDLTGVNLSAADLSRAHITQAQIAHAPTDEKTQLPPGISRPVDPWPQGGPDCRSYVTTLDGASP